MLVLSTGGTISSRRDDAGAYVASDKADQLVSNLLVADVTIEAQDIMRVGSYLLTPENMVEVARRIREGLHSEDVVGIVVTHGTDTMEETAFLADLVHTDARAVVFTGAQRAADAPDADGPRNLADAITVAADEDARGLGVLIVFDGQIFAASGTRKTQTLAPNAFSSSTPGALGRVRNGSAVFYATPRRFDPLELRSLDLTDVQVDIVPYYPGATTTALRAVAAGAAIPKPTPTNDGEASDSSGLTGPISIGDGFSRGAAASPAFGIILEATGAGNANPEFCSEVARLTAAGVIVALSTRVDAGPVTAIYGAGGGIDLVDAGAIPVGTLRSPQARILLIALLATGASSTTSGTDITGMATTSTTSAADRVRSELRRRAR